MNKYSNNNRTDAASEVNTNETSNSSDNKNTRYSKHSNNKYNKSRSKGSQNTSSYNKRAGGKQDKQPVKAKDASTLTNDPSFWSADPELLGSAIVRPTDWPGNEIDLGTGAIEHKYTAPGLMVHELMPTYGYNNSWRDPINLGPTNYYAFLKNRKYATKYDAPDLTCYTIACAEIFSAISFLKRAYAIKNYVALTNKYLGETFFEAMGLLWDDWNKNCSTFINKWHQLEMAVAPFYIPALDIFKLKQTSYNYIYKESQDMMDQFHMCVPSGFFAFSHDTDGASQLSMQTWYDGGNPKTMEQAIDFVIGLVERLGRDASCLAISSDLMYNLNANELAIWPTALEELTIDKVFVYDPIFLYRFKNSTVTSSPITQTDIIQDSTKGYLKSNPVTIVGANEMNYYLRDDKLLTTPMWAPDPISVTEFTMFTPAVQPVSGSESTMTIVSGFYIQTAAGIYSMKPNGTIRVDWLDPDMGSSVEEIHTWIQTIFKAKSFKYCPRLIVLADDKYCEFVDADSLSTITNENLVDVHKGALMNAFSVQLTNTARSSIVTSMMNKAK